MKRKSWTESDKLICPQCQSKHSCLVDTRSSNDNLSIRRRRKCDNGHRFTTIETIVVKKIASEELPLAITRTTIRFIQRQIELAYELGRTDSAEIAEKLP